MFFRPKTRTELEEKFLINNHRKTIYALPAGRYTGCVITCCFQRFCPQTEETVHLCLRSFVAIFGGCSSVFTIDHI